jgi:ssDNA-specific exonuclease RecJ
MYNLLQELKQKAKASTSNHWTATDILWAENIFGRFYNLRNYFLKTKNIDSFNWSYTNITTKDNINISKYLFNKVKLLLKETGFIDYERGRGNLFNQIDIVY